MTQTSGGAGRSEGRPRSLREALSPREIEAATELVRRVRACVAAELVQASLFGSAARGQARPDSDIDLLLVFRRLPPDREPQATHAEEIADRVAEHSGVPVTVWSVALVDLEEGRRTPMLVDALHDSIPVWWSGAPLPALPFTPPDALRCAGALLDRVEEGSEEFAALAGAGDAPGAARRLRDDLVRACIGLHLLEGVTQPRRGDAARGVLRHWPELPPWARPVLRWAAGSYGPDGRDDEAPVPPPPGGLEAGARAVDLLRGMVAASARRVARSLERG